MANLLNDNNSPFRQPEDLCPELFEVDPFGAIFESSYIAILPFIPHEKLFQIYESMGEINDERNQNKLGIIVKKSLNLYKVDDCGYLKGFEFGIHVENLDFDKL